MNIAVPGLILILIALLILGSLAAVVYALVYAIANKRPGVAVAAILLPLVALIGVPLFVTGLAHAPSVAHNRAVAMRELTEQTRLHVEEVQRHALEAARQAEELQNKAGATDGKSIHELWEQLNQPRIKLEANDRGASMTVGDGPNQVELRADGENGAKLVAPLPKETAESLSRSITRLERMVRHVSAVADQVSDAGTLIGRAMIVLSDSMDSQPPHAPPAPIVQVDERKAIEPAAPVEPSAEPAAPAAWADANEEAADTYSSLAQIPHSSGESSDGSSDVNARPAWVDLLPKKIGNAQREVVVAGDFATREECERETDC
jgi:hypothetical protein